MDRYWTIRRSRIYEDLKGIKNELSYIAVSKVLTERENTVFSKLTEVIEDIMLNWDERNLEAHRRHHKPVPEEVPSPQTKYWE